jgi:hypothetical protein
MEKDKIKNYLTTYKKLIKQGKDTLDRYGWNGKSYKDKFPDKQEYILFFENSKRLIFEIFGSESIYYTQLAKNLDKFYTSTVYYYFIYQILENSFKTFKDIAGEDLFNLENRNSREKLSDINNKDKPIFVLKYNEWSREIYINERLLKRPQYNSVNHIVFEYLYNNPNTEVSLKTLQKVVESELGYEFTKPIIRIANDLGFTRDRRKLFFITSQYSAKLRTEITQEILDSMKIDTENILPQ